ncbi:MAG: hypothetical protein HRU23_07095 [Gammaproteobacteria bacterium]|nr:hypothetical protein [Gammaproteobacteria bacterium]
MNMPLDVPLTPEEVTLPSKRRQLKITDGAIYFRALMDNAGKVVFETPVGRILYIVIFVVQIFFLYWSLEIRLPVIHTNLNLLSQKIQLESEVKSQYRKWSEDEFNKIEQDISIAEAKIFENFEQLAQWLIEQSDYAQSLKIKMTYLIGDAAKLSLNNTFSFPIEIQLSVEQAKNESPYTKMLDFTQNMIQGHHHLEILATKVKSNGNGVTFFTLDINLWVKDSTYILNAIEPTTKSHQEEGMDVPFNQ